MNESWDCLQSKCHREEILFEEQVGSLKTENEKTSRS